MVYSNNITTWEFLFVKYEINILTQEEGIYINGDLHEKRSLYGGIFGFFQSELFYNFVRERGLEGWELQSDWGSDTSRNLTFKRPLSATNNFQDYDEQPNGKSNEDLSELQIEILENLIKIKDKLNTIEFALRGIPKQKQIFALGERLSAIESALKTIPEEKLVSSLGIDYTRLHDLLAVGNWREADRETYKILISASKRQEYGWLDSESIKNFPSKDLLTINRLWMEYSNGHFGYSIQKRMLETLVNKSKEQHDSIKKQFGELVGWRVNEEWLKYQELTFQLNAPQGHLPTVNLGWDTEGDWLRYSEFLSRRVF